MERRRFIGTGLALGAAGTGLLTGTACGTLAGAGAAPAAPPPQAAPAPGTVRLGSNENPLGLAPAARRAILEGLGDANRYPREARTALIAALAARHQVAPEQIQLGTGSTEILQMAVQATHPAATIVIAEPTFEDVARYAAASGRRVSAVPLRADWAHDVAAMRAAAGDGPALVFLCNPNNPTGTITPCDETDAWIAEAPPGVTFLVDEAYFEFVDDARYRAATGWIARKSNVVVSRTFSKIHGMAGLRLGYAVAQADTIRRLGLQACSNNVNQLALVAGLAALGDTAFHERSLAGNRAARRVLTDALDALGIEYLPSHTNFVMHRIGTDVTRYNPAMREAGFIVGRPFPPLTGYSRVSLGRPEEMERFVTALRALRAAGRA